MTITINHGEPKTPFFLIVQPKKSYDEPRGVGKTLIILHDPKNKVDLKTEYHGCYEVPISDLQTFNMLAHLAYGISGEKLKEELMKKYQELNEPDAIVEYWILKRI